MEKSDPIVLVANVTAPLVVAYPVPMTVTPPVPTQTPFTAKQPAERFIPFAAVVVAVPNVSAPLTVNEPEIRPLPCTERVCEGDVVPRPSRPDDVKTEPTVPEVL